MGLTSEYPNLNIVLNDYCLWMEDSQFLNNLSYFYHLTIKLKKLLEKDFTCQELEELYDKAKEESRYLSLTETLLLTTEYIEERLPQYKTRFLKCLSDGTINIVADPEDIYEKNKNNEAGRDRKKHLYANVVLRHNAKDPVTLVHEFLHTINNEPDNRISRKYITEAISIYFESDMCEFLKRKGFTEKELMINDIFRHADLSGCVDDLMPIFPLLDSFRLLGPINSDSYDRMQQLSIEPLAMSKEEFYSKTSNFEERLARVRKRNELLHITDGPKPQEPLVTFGYVIGTIIAYYGIENGTDDIHQRMIHLNNIANKATFSDLLSYIDIDITNEKELLKKIVPPLNKKIQKIKAYSSGEKNEPKEK